MRSGSRFPPGVVADGLRRAAAVACLGSSYALAESNFRSIPWLAATVISALVLASGPARWLFASASAAPALSRPAGRLLWLGFVPGWLLCLIAGVAKALFLSPRLAIGAWVAGAAWVLVAAYRASPPRGPHPPAGSARAACLGLLAIFTVATALRLWEIDRVPRNVHCDEGIVTFTARAFYDNPNRDWFAPPPEAGVYSVLHMYYALAGLGTLPFGVNVTGARSASVALGLLSVLLWHDGLRRVTTARTALAAAALLAVSHAHIAFSRIATGCIQPAFVVALAFALLARLWTRPTYLNAAGLGVALAWGVQTYTPSMAVPGLLGVALAILAVLRREHVRRLRVPWVLFAITAAAAAAPVAVAVAHHHRALTARSTEVNIFMPHKMQQLMREVYRTDSAWVVVGRQAWAGLTGFQTGEDGQPHYSPPAALADRYTAALMIPGAILALGAARSFAAVTTLVLAVGSLLLGLGMQWAMGFERATAALPPGMTIAAIALVQCADTFWGGRRPWSRGAAAASLVPALLWCGAANARVYFVDFAEARTAGDGGSEAGWLALRYEREYTVHLVSFRPSAPGSEGLRLIVHGRGIRDTPRDAEPLTYARTVRPTGHDLFIVYQDHPDARDALLARFPAARLEVWQPNPHGGARLYLVFVGPPRAAL